MRGYSGTPYDENLKQASNKSDYTEFLNALQDINDFFIKIYKIENIDGVCRLVGEAVHKLNKNCYVIVSLYDNNVNAVRIKAAIGFEGLKEIMNEATDGNPELIFFDLKGLEKNKHLFSNGKLKPYEGKLYTLLSKKVPYEISTKIEKRLNIGCIQVISCSYKEEIIGSIIILVPEGQKIKNVSAIESIVDHAYMKIDFLKTKKALQEAESRFELLIKQAPLSYQSLDEKGYLIDVNSTWLDTLGYSWEEVAGKCFVEFLAPEYAEIFKNNHLKFKLQGKIQGVEYEAIRKDGKRINILVDGKIAYDENGKFKQTLCVFKDVTAQKNAERRAIENEKLLRSTIDAITESVIVLRPDNTVLYMNECAAKRLKTNPQKCVGCYIGSLIPKETWILRKKVLDTVLAEGKAVKFEDVRDGISFLHNYYPVFDSTNQFSNFSLFSMDITKYKKSERKLKWELAVNRTLAELADALIDPSNSIEAIANIVLVASQELTGSEHGYVSSIDSETGDNVCHTLTEMMEKCDIQKDSKKIVFPKGPDGLYPKLHGYVLNTKKGFYTNSPKTHSVSEGTPKGHINLNNFLSVPAVVGEELMGQISLANSKQGYSDFELDAIKKVATLYALAIQQKRTSLIIQYTDNILKSIFESTVYGIFVVDVKNKILLSNSNLVKLLKLPESLVNTKSYEDLLTFILNQVKYPDEYILKSQAIFKSNEVDATYIDFKDGRVLERVSTPLLIDGVLKGRVLSFSDVTEKVEAEKALINSKIHAEEANRTKSEFLATMSHELRTPLNSVIGFSDVLLAQMYGSLNEKQLRYLNNISISGHHLLNLINDILDISRIESGDISLFSEIILIKDIFEDVRNIAITFASSRNITLEFSAEPDDLKIVVDKIKLKQILHNLVNNALKFTPENGHVVVKAKRSERAIEISVTDNGIGIPEDRQKMIFEPFKQVDSSLSRMYGGTGLGLNIVKKFVEMLGGEIRVKSETGKGSIFTVLLPVKE